MYTVNHLNKSDAFNVVNINLDLVSCRFHTCTEDHVDCFLSLVLYFVQTISDLWLEVMELLKFHSILWYGLFVTLQS